MNAPRERIAKNQGKVEFISCLDEIQSMIEQGYNKRNIHDKFSRSGKFTMSYFTFCDNYKKFYKKNSKKAAATQSKGVAAASTTAFLKPQEIDSETIF